MCGWVSAYIARVHDIEDEIQTINFLMNEFQMEDLIKFWSLSQKALDLRKRNPPSACKILKHRFWIISFIVQYSVLCYCKLLAGKVFPEHLYTGLLCRLWSIVAHRDHFVQHLSVCLSGSHTFLVVTHSYVLQATHAFFGMLPLCLYSVLSKWHGTIQCKENKFIIFEHLEKDNYTHFTRSIFPWRN